MYVVVVVVVPVSPLRGVYFVTLPDVSVGAPWNDGVSNRDKNWRDRTIVPHFYHNTVDIVSHWTGLTIFYILSLVSLSFCVSRKLWFREKGNLAMGFFSGCSKWLLFVSNFLVFVSISYHIHPPGIIWAISRFSPVLALVWEYGFLWTSHPL